MFVFSKPLHFGQDPATGATVLGFLIDDFFVFDPHLSECGHVKSDPQVCSVPSHRAR